MATVLCMRWGWRYGPDDVNRLFAMVDRHLHRAHRFVCLTDDARGLRQGIECRPLPALELMPAWERSPWRKLSCLSPALHDLKGDILFLDLDVVIVAAIDCFFDHPGAFCIIENWTQRGRGIGNSSVFRFRAGAHGEILEDFRRRAAEVVRRHDNEQTFLSRSIGELTFWPEAWCRSFKRDCLPGRLLRPFRTATLPEGARIIVFHGQPKPPHAAQGIGPERFRRLRPVPWVGQHWG